MKTLGIIGGIGPESTIEYYRSTVALYRERIENGNCPSIIINSIDMKKMLDLIGADNLAEATLYLAAELHKLERAGADFAVLAANTPHIVFDEIQRQTPLPMISIVEATAEEAKKIGVKKLGLFGTRFTMRAGFYQKIFYEHGITLIIPEKTEQDYIHEKYVGELLNGIFLLETREQLLGIVANLKERGNIDGLILGGTELPLILRDADYRGIPFLDTTKIHVNKIVARLLSEK